MTHLRPWWKAVAGKTKKVWALLLVFVTPYCVIYLSGVPYWLGRIIATAILIGFITVASFWFSLSSKSEVIATGAKANRPNLLKRKKTVASAVRILGVVFGIFFTAHITLPFIADVVDVFRKRQPATITGRIAENKSIFGLSYLKQSLYLDDNHGSQDDSYTLLYSFSVLNVGQEYELTILSRSMIVLNQRDLSKR